MVFAKKHLAIISIAVVSVCGSIVAAHSISRSMKGLNPVGSINSYTMTLNSSNKPASLTAGYQNTFSDTVKTQKNNDVQLTFVNAKQLEDGFAQLAPRGMIHNFGADDDAITAVNGVSFTGTGTLLFKPAVTSGAYGAILPDVAPIAIAAGASTVTVPTCDYFQLVADEGGAEIQSLQFSYSCDPLAYDIKLLNGTYTGVGSDGSTYKAVITDGAGVLDSLDKASNLHLEGTAVMTSKTDVRCTFVYNTYNIYYDFTYNGHSLTYVAKSDDFGGAVANNVAELSLDRVYNLDNFESYTKTGTGYVDADSKYTTSGLRANYFADYYTGSSSGEIGGNGWPVMTSTDNSNYNGSKGHNGSKVGIFKFSNNMGMRYISMNELYGVKTISKGAVLSFWARGAYTNTSFNTNHASDTPMKFYAYYGSPLTPSNQTTVRETYDFTVTAGATWQHFEMPLQAGRAYYGFGFYAQQKSGSTQYVPIDDIMIYTASPYAEYVAPVAATGVTVSPDNLELVVGGHSQLTATVAPNDATNKSVAWSSNNTGVATVDATGYVTAVAAGSATITATTEDGGYTDTCAVTVSAPVVAYPSGTFKGTAVVSGNNFDIVLAIGDQSNGLVAVRLSNKDAEATAISFNSGTNAITITTTGNYMGGTYGNITGTYDPANNQITNIACSGSISSYVSNNGSITATAAATSSTSFFADCDGTTEQLQAQFKRRYSGSNVDTSNADRITQNTAQYVNGSSLKLRGYSGGDVRLNLNNDFSPAKAMKNIHFWVYNPTASTSIKVRVWVYTATNLGGNAEVIDGGFALNPNGWTYCSVGYDKTVYNFQLGDFTNSGAYLSFDNIYLF